MKRTSTIHYFINCALAMGLGSAFINCMKVFSIFKLLIVMIIFIAAILNIACGPEK